MYSDLFILLLTITNILFGADMGRISNSDLLRIGNIQPSSLLVPSNSCMVNFCLLDIHTGFKLKYNNTIHTIYYTFTLHPPKRFKYLNIIGSYYLYLNLFDIYSIGLGCRYAKSIDFYIDTTQYSILFGSEYTF